MLNKKTNNIASTSKLANHIIKNMKANTNKCLLMLISLMALNARADYQIIANGETNICKSYAVSVIGTTTAKGGGGIISGGSATAVSVNTETKFRIILYDVDENTINIQKTAFKEQDVSFFLLESAKNFQSYLTAHTTMDFSCESFSFKKIN